MAIDTLRERDRRNAEFFGGPGQQKLRSTRALIIGVGGLGSALAQHLALLGVMHIGLADDEQLDETNRNRFIGAMVSDPVPRSFKVNIAERLIESIDVDISVSTIKDQLLSSEVFQAVRECDWVFGCFDEDGPRSTLNELAVAYDKTYIDLASDVPDHGVFGGHVITVSAGTGCLACMGVLDQRDLRRYFSTDDQLDAEARIYGIDHRVLDGRGPSVSPMNGVVASLAASEFMLGVTGMRQPVGQIQYRGHVPSVRANADQPRKDCYVCSLRGKGAVAEAERFLHLEHIRERRTKKVGFSTPHPPSVTQQ